MKRLIPLAAVLAAAALATTGCNRPGTQSTAYNNSGTDATRAQPATTTTTTTTDTTVSATTPAGPSGATNAASTPTTGDTSTTNASSTGSAADNANSGNAVGAVSETVTTGKIKAAIASDSAMKDSDISVTTNNGVVTLSGSVKSQDQIAIATNLAQRQEGVTRVESNVTVR